MSLENNFKIQFTDILSICITKIKITTIDTCFAGQT